MERRGRIPVAKFRTQEGKTRSRSRVREPDYNEQDPETDLFTLLEDNIALKEANKALKSQLEESKTKQTSLETESYKITERLEEFKKHQEELEAKLQNVTVQLKEVQNEKDVLDKAYKTLQGAAVELESSPISSQTQHNVGIVATAALKTKLLQIVFAETDSAEREMDEESMANTPLTIDLIEKMVDGFLTLKTSMNAVELQLYEANERISELLENQQHVEHDNEALRTENINLTKVAKLLTENMKESVETSKKMEAALIKLKQRNDDLMAKNRDRIDGPTTSNAVTNTTRPDNNAAKQLEITEQVEKQNRDHGERIVEMPSEVEAALQITTNDEQLKSLKLKLAIVEAELREVTARAQLAENELEKYKLLEKEKGKQRQQQQQRPPPPPTPPPMPDGLLYKASFCLRDSRDQVTCEGGVGSAGEYNFPSTNTVLGSCSQIPKLPDRKIIDTVKQQMKPEAATGVDALVRELKSGRVTLRRNRRKTRTNEALQEMFQVLEISQQQNRNSKVCMNLNL